MFTQVYLYILFYLLTVLILFYYFFVYRAHNSITQLTFSQIWSATTLYFKQSWIFRFLILQLSGLPPVFFFFLKFSFLLSSFNYLTIFLIVLIFINLLLSVFFYLKVYSATEVKTSNILLKKLTVDSPLSKTLTKKFAKREYAFTYFAILFIFISLFSFIFFIDFYFIVKCFMVY